MNKNYKIVIFGLPASGHINPLFPIIKELAKMNQLKLIVYLTPDFKEQFDAINILNNVELRMNLSQRALEYSEEYRWEKCVLETITFIRNI